MEPQLVVPEDWERMFGNLFLSSSPEAGASVKGIEAKKARIAVFGGNRVGKSTFNRWLINKLLESVESGGIKDVSSVVYVDLDPGQAEFTPPGVISVLRISEPIHGSNYTRLGIPILSKFLGSLNVSDCARIYVRSCKELLEYMNSQPRFQDLPWVINTMGFSRGLGVTLACELISLFTPNVVIQIGLSGLKGEDKRVFPFHLNQTEVSKYLRGVRPHVDGIGADFMKEYQFFSVDSVLCSFPDPVRKSIWNANARGLRDRVMTSYFALTTQSTDDNKITSAVPRLVSLDDVTIATMQSTMSYDEILLAMNGNLVALCSINTPQATHLSQRMLVKADRFPNEFVGYGIVRAIDRTKKLLYIITPLPEELLVDQVNCIVTAGSIGLPPNLYLDGLNQAEDARLPYLEHKSQASSKLNESATRRFVPNRVATHSALKTCFL